MVRKLVMTVGIVLFLQHTKVGLGGIITIAMSFTVIQAMKNPIKDRFENFLQLLSVTIIPINLSIGAVLQAKEIGDADIIDDRKDSLALGLLLVCLNSLLVIMVFGRFVKAVAKKVSHRRENGEEACSCRRFVACCCSCVQLSPVNRHIRHIESSSFL